MAVRFPDTLQPLDPVEIDINSSKHLMIDYDSTCHLTKLRKNCQNSGGLSCPIGVAIDDHSNNIYVTEYSPASVSIFSDSGEFLNSFTHERMRYPWGIAIYRNSVYVSDIGVYGLFHFKIGSDIHLDAALVGMGSCNENFSCPLQLTVSEDGEVFIADCNNHRIQILDQSLHFQRSIKHDSMEHPRDVKLTNDEVFVLTNTSPCVIVFSHAGEILRSFITRGEGMQVIDPWFFCLDAHQNLIISDYGANHVSVFSHDGMLIHSIKVGTKFYSGIEGLALTKNLKIVVITRNERLQLHIYSF